jgi:hypothetical protein
MYTLYTLEAMSGQTNCKWYDDILLPLKYVKEKKTTVNERKTNDIL